MVATATCGGLCGLSFKISVQMAEEGSCCLCCYLVAARSLVKDPFWRQVFESSIVVLKFSILLYVKYDNKCSSYKAPSSYF
jgi:hypothetical protein